MPSSVAIRLAVEGGAEVKRAFDEAGRAGQAAFQGVGAAADQAAVAVDRQTAKYQRLAQAAREAEAQARAQANINSLLGVGQGSSGSARDSASAFDAALARQDQIQAARQAQAAQSAQANLNQLLGVRDAQVGAARASASAFEEVYQREAEALKRASDLRASAVRNAATGWRDLGSAGAVALANIEASRRLGSLGVGPQAANENARLRPDQVQNLLYQGGDVLSQLGSGSPLGMIAFQQGPQIAQTFAGPGGASVKSAFAQAGEAVSGFVSRIGLVGGALGVVGGAVITAAAALASYRSGQRDVELQLLGVGRASGVTATQINALADAQARAGGMSRGSAREFAAGFAATGAIGADQIGGLLGTTRDFAKVTGQDAKDAAKDLASAFADPARGADELNRRLGFLNDTTRETVRRLAEQGDRVGAQQALFAAYRDSIAGAAEATQGWARITENLSNWWDHLGASVSKGLFGGTLDQELAKAQDRLSKAQVAAEGGFGLFSSKDVENAQKEVSRLSSLIDQRNAKIQQAQRAQRSLEVGGLIRSLLPDQQQVDDLANKVEKLRRAVSDPVKFGLDTQGFAVAESSLGRISRLWQTMADDVARYGSAQTAALVRSAEFSNRLVGATPYGRSSADLERTYQEELRKKGLDPVETRRAADAAREEYNRRLSDPNIDPAEGRALSAAREASQRSLREMEGLQRARDLELETLRKTQSIDQIGVGGAFSRLPAEVQQQFLRAGQNSRYANVPLGVAAAITGPESRGDLDIGFSKSLGEDGRRSSAYGLGQITRGTAEEAVRLGYLPQGFDRTDRDTMAEGILGVLSMKIAQNGGDVTRGVMAYRGSSDPAVNRAYAAEVMRNAGQMGDASTLGVVRDSDANARALDAQSQQLRNATENYGRNGLALEANARASQQLSDMQARGVVVTDDLRASILKFANESASQAQRLKLVQFANDNTFDREQLGRDRIDQSAYARARQVVGDTNSPAAKSVIEASRLNDNLRQTKDLATDAFSGMLTDLRQGAGFMSAMGNAAGRFADRLLSLAADKAVSGLFGSLLGGGGSKSDGDGLGGAFSAIGKFFTGGSAIPTFDVGGYTGHGGRYDVAGFVHRGEVVFSQADVARNGGLGTVEMIRQGALRGYADGGPVGGYTMPGKGMATAANANMGMNVVINEAPGGDQAQTRMGRGPTGNPQLIVDMISRQQASDIAQGRGPLAMSSGGRRLRG